MTGTICFFNTNPEWGGGEKWHYEMAVKCYRSKINVIAVAHPDGALYQKYQESGIPVQAEIIKNLSFLNPLKINSVKAFLKENNISTLIVNLPSEVKAVTIAAKWAGVKTIIYRRGSAKAISNSLINRLVFKKMLTHVIANSEETKRLINAHGELISPEKITVIYNGINTSNLPQINFHQDRLILGSAGRLSPEKNHKILLDITSALKKENISFNLLIAGSGPLKDELKSIIKAKDINEEVTLTGFQHDIHSFMNELDVFILPSDYEGFGFVMIEAMLHGKPVIAFKHSSIPEIVLDGITGILVKPGDVNGVVTAIKKLRAIETRTQMGKAAQDHVVKNFSEEKAFLKLKELVFN